MELDSLLQQNRGLAQCSDEFLDIRAGLGRHKERLSEAWVSREMEEMNDIIDRMRREAGRISEELEMIERDIIKAYEELAEENG